jgi:hypothetical protein
MLCSDGWDEHDGPTEEVTTLPNGTQTDGLAGVETRDMRFFTTVLKDKGPLSSYIAARRAPGRGWETWEQIVFDLHADTGETVTRAGLTNWARRYGIPIDTRATGDAAGYLATIRECGITIPQ